MALTPEQQAAQDALNSVAYRQYIDSATAAKNLQKQTQDTAKKRYDQTFMENIKNLGWMPTSADPNQAGGAGNWDYGQLRDQGITTKSGAGLWGQLQDFASRGALRSTEFSKSRNTALNDFSKQRADLIGGRAQFGEQQQGDWSAFQQQQERDRLAALDQAKRDALSRILNQNAGSVGL